MESGSWTALQKAVVQTFPPSTELTESDGAAGDDFGYAVAVSGTTAFVGDPGKTIGANSSQGAVYVFTFNARGYKRRN